MQFLGDLGVNIWLLIAQIVNFLFLLWVLSKFVYKPLLKRIELDEKALAEVEKAEIELEKKEKQLETKQKQLNTRTKNRAKAIISEAEEIAKAIKESAQQEAQAEKQAVIDQINRRLAEMSHDNG
jgi:F-type H+-transporting ATPase subunit b